MSSDLRTCDLSMDLSSQLIDQPSSLISSRRDSLLEGLIAQNNKNIKFIPENISDKFLNLELLQFENTSINSIHKKHFKGLHKLRYLNLARNEIETVEKGSFDDNGNLEDLWLNGNQIEFLSSEIFKSLTRLEKLWLHDNEIKFLPVKIFSSLQNLKELVLLNNKIIFLPENIFENLINIKKIDLTNNSLTDIPKNLFSKNSNLEFIWLNGNEIKTMSSTLFDGKNNLIHFGLQGTCAGRSYTTNKFDKKDEDEMKNDLVTKCQSIEEKNIKLMEEISNLNETIADFQNKTICLEDKIADEASQSKNKTFLDHILFKIFFGNWKYILS
jgi:Leucine-rich repeat (LRR) protein